MDFFPQNFKERCRIFSSMMSFLFEVHCSSQNHNAVQEAFGKVGKSHQAMGVRPWMYRAFAEAFLTVSAESIQDVSNREVLQNAWCDIFTSALKGICRAEITKKNISSNFFDVRY
mmetsp:Transcript_40840/g.52576  ORF Transcript_40840/g.52576 Transcript_40840/m.52576 type:complete len:115 (-) Transcript_40840:150-494(-)